MADKKRNALADLAEFLKEESTPMGEEFKAKAIERFGVERRRKHEERKRKFEKCSRILSELAKVKPYFEPGQTFMTYRDEVQGAYEKCLSVSEDESK